MSQLTNMHVEQAMAGLDAAVVHHATIVRRCGFNPDLVETKSLHCVYLDAIRYAIARLKRSKRKKK